MEAQPGGGRVIRLVAEGLDPIYQSVANTLVRYRISRVDFAVSDKNVSLSRWTLLKNRKLIRPTS